MIYIQTIESIGHQDSFQKDNIWDFIEPIKAESTVVTPDYKNYISPASLRRLSPVLRMALATAKECQAQIKQEIDAISVGTSLGCLVDTEKFLVTFLTANSDTLSPTAFIQSTHNTIAGQLSLEMKNRSYNMTHTQNSLSFEQAMLDAVMCSKEGKQAVLLGAADEAIGFLELLKPTLINSDLQLTSGSTFMVLGPKTNSDSIAIVDFLISFNVENRDQQIYDFLQKNELDVTDIDQFIVSGEEVSKHYAGSIDYLKYTGLYFTASAFAVHMGHDWLKKMKKNYVLIINEQQQGKLGLVLLKRDDTPH